MFRVVSVPVKIPADINFVYDSFCLATDAMEFTAC